MTLHRAITYAKLCHAGQTRITGEPYMQHVLNVLAILERYGVDEEVLTAGVLHDVNEDTKSTNPDIANTFGSRVATMVYALSKNQKHHPTKTTHQQIGNTRLGFYLLRLEREAVYEPGIIFIKMADQIDNLSSLQVFPPEKQQRKIKEIKDEFIPLYDRVAKSFVPELQNKYKRLRIELLKELNAKEV